MKKLLVTFALVALIAASAIVWRAGPLRAAPEPRIALVIGNGSYGPAIGDLKNPVSDARLMAKTLMGVGFHVEKLENANRAQMRAAIVAFGKRLSAAGPMAVGMFYFAGHGFQTGGRNWLVPVGAVVNSEAQIEDETVRADSVLQEMDLAHNQLNILILDACRNNPFARSFRGVQRGLAAIEAPTNSVIGYATAPGDVAADGAGANSPYASALAAEISGGSDPIEILMRKVTARVKSSTANRQSPYVNSSLDREFRFRAVLLTTEELEREEWRALGQNPSQAELEAFLKAFPNGKFAGLARAKLADLKGQPSSPLPAPGAAFRDCAQCPVMVVVPKGQFMMGARKEERGSADDERPQHGVTIPRNFAVGKFEITNAEYGLCVADGGCTPAWIGESGGRAGDWARMPVVTVNWDSAKVFVRWLNSKLASSRGKYRLLSEAEWEYAARAGTRTPYPWGQDASHERANYGGDKCTGDYCGHVEGRDKWGNQPSPVGQFPPNQFGLFDMHGNVWEWTEDCWTRDYVGAPNGGTARVPSGYCEARVMRGGGWNNNAASIRSAVRWREPETNKSGDGGFRVARDE